MLVTVGAVVRRLWSPSVVTSEESSSRPADVTGSVQPFAILIKKMYSFEPAADDREDVGDDLEGWAEYAVAEHEVELNRLGREFSDYRLELERRARDDRAVAVQELDAAIGTASGLLAICQEAVAAGRAVPAQDVAYACTVVWQRGIAVAYEINALLRAGLSTGAEARWRTLLECAVVAATLEAGNRTTARKFVEHRRVQLWHDLRHELNSGRFTDHDLRRVERDHDRLLKKHGKAFATPYGWATDVVQPAGGQLALRHLMRAADMDRHHGAYRQAHHRVHADSLGGMTLVDPVSGQLHAGATYQDVESICAETMDLLMMLNDHCVKMFFRRRNGMESARL
jgi:hypothetical protein